MTAGEAATIKDFSKCDFTQIHRYYTERSEARKNMSKEEKAAIKLENEKILEEHGWAIVDGHRSVKYTNKLAGHKGYMYM